MPPPTLSQSVILIATVGAPLSSEASCSAHRRAGPPRVLEIRRQSEWRVERQAKPDPVGQPHRDISRRKHRGLAAVGRLIGETEGAEGGERGRQKCRGSGLRRLREQDGGRCLDRQLARLRNRRRVPEHRGQRSPRRNACIRGAFAPRALLTQCQTAGNGLRCPDRQGDERSRPQDSNAMLPHVPAPTLHVASYNCCKRCAVTGESGKSL